MCTAAVLNEYPTYLAAEAFPQFALLDLNASGKLALAAATGRGQFIANREAFAADEDISVTPTNHPGILRMVASGAMSLGDDARLDGAGKVASDGAGRVIGQVMAAVTADADVVYVVSSGGGDADGVVADADGATLTAQQSGQTILNTGATGAAVFALPPATVGLNYRFFVNAAYELRIDPDGTETIALPSTGAQSAAGKYIAADAVGEFCDVVCLVAGRWEVLSYKGTWTAEG